MKVYINKYKNHWISPYTICEKICFWREIDYDEPWVEKTNKVLYPIMNVVSKVWGFFDRKINYVKIDRWDTWSMDFTLAHIIVPMLKQLRDTKHGYPMVDDEDVPEYLRSHMAQPKEYEWDADSLAEARWDWVMNEMIWSFEQLHPDCDWEDQYHSGVSDIIFKKIEGSNCSEMVKGPNDTSSFDVEGYKAHSARIDKGLVLFGKYYRGLWD